MSPLEIGHLQDLAKKIKDMHGIAYKWDTNSSIIESNILSIVQNSVNIAVQDRTRQTIKSVVKFLDKNFEENE